MSYIRLRIELYFPQNNGKYTDIDTDTNTTTE